MNYEDKRKMLLDNIKQGVQARSLNISLCPTPGLEDFAIFQDLNGNKFIFHQKEFLWAADASGSVPAF